MNIELKSITHNERMSEETNCYSAKLFVDGVHVCDVSNRGCGGADNIHMIKGGWSTQQVWQIADLEEICSNILTKWLVTRDIKKNFKKSVCFILAGESLDAVRTSGFKGVKVLTDEQKNRVKAMIVAKYPTAIVLNDKTDAEISAMVAL